MLSDYIGSISSQNFSNSCSKVQVVAIVDPVSEAAQRISPLLRVIRDQLKLPLQVILKPATVLSNDAKIPITSYYRFVADPTALADPTSAKALFSNLPSIHILTMQVDVPEPWNVQQTAAVQDTDNLRCDVQSGCSDDVQKMHATTGSPLPVYEQRHLTKVEYGLKDLLVFGQCYEDKASPPNGLQLTLSRVSSSLPEWSPSTGKIEVGIDGSIVEDNPPDEEGEVSPIYSDTLVMKNVGYWQLRANPGIWTLRIAKHSKGAEIFEMVEGNVKNGRIVTTSGVPSLSKRVVMKDFVNKGELLVVRRHPGFDEASIFHDETDVATLDNDNEVINVFSLATGHLYERFLKIMMLSVTKRTSSKVKFWLFENFLSPTFKSSARAMAKRIGCEVEFVTYKWPEWLRGQSEKQRIIWGYKILFLDVLFPLNVKKIIYVDADQGKLQS